MGCQQKMKIPDLRETYGYKDTHPFGGYVAYHIVEQSFPDNWINDKNDPFSEDLNWLTDTASLYISISNELYVDDKDVTRLLDFIYKGNTAFLAASQFDTTLLNKLYCKVKNYDFLARLQPRTFTTTSLRLIDGITTFKEKPLQYFYLPFLNSFSEINAAYCRKVGYNQNDEPNCIVLFWGKGKLFLHCDPRAFSNYFLLQGSNYQYLTQLLQVMPKTPEHVYWNSYYVKKTYKGGGSSFSSLSTIFKYPPLIWAFWLALALLLLYIFFNGKRRQRIVPVIPPVKNSSVAFAEAIGGLYLKEKDNKTIAQKMITYFNEHIRTSYFLNTNLVNEDFLISLSRKSGVELIKIKRLYYDMQHATDSPEVKDTMLLSINEQIQEFYKTKN
jgi:hypothetical protein